MSVRILHELSGYHVLLGPTFGPQDSPELCLRVGGGGPSTSHWYHAGSLSRPHSSGLNTTGIHSLTVLEARKPGSGCPQGCFVSGSLTESPSFASSQCLMSGGAGHPGCSWAGSGLAPFPPLSSRGSLRGFLPTFPSSYKETNPWVEGHRPPPI